MIYIPSTSLSQVYLYLQIYMYIYIYIFQNETKAFFRVTYFEGLTKFERVMGLLSEHQTAPWFKSILKMLSLHSHPGLFSLLKPIVGTRIVNKIVMLLYRDEAYAATVKGSSFLVYLGVSLLLDIVLMFGEYAFSMHNQIRDERYITGLTLNNLNVPNPPFN
jgi:hypothetical protein